MKANHEQERELINMSDRIIVLSRRPAIVKKIYNIHFHDRKLPVENRKLEEFSSYYEKIWSDLDVHI